MHEHMTPSGIAYRSSDNDPSKATIVLLHGLTGSASSWERYEQALSRDHNLAVVDLRGHGLSKKYPHYRDYTLSNIADDVQEVMREAKVERCILVGHSFGTLIALELVRRNDPSIVSVVFMSPNFAAAGTMLAKLTRPLLRMGAWACDHLPMRSRTLGRVDYTPYKKPSDWDISLNIADIRNTTLRVYLFCLLQIYDTDVSEAWKQVSIPTLIVHGTRDTVIPYANARRLHETIPHSVLHPIPEGNHLFVLSRIQETIVAITDFVD